MNYGYDTCSENFEGPGRGDSTRRGRLTNGTAATRGRGGRGRGSSMGPRTFQNRQAASFPDSIDTWGPPSDDKTTQNSLKIGKYYCVHLLNLLHYWMYDAPLIPLFLLISCLKVLIMIWSKAMNVK